MFSDSELDMLVCGDKGENWSMDLLLKAVHPAHGYAREDETYLNLIHFMLSLDGNDQRRFLSFVTGCPRLPIGGLLALKPPLTVVKKDP